MPGISRTTSRGIILQDEWRKASSGASDTTEESTREPVIPSKKPSKKTGKKPSKKTGKKPRRVGVGAKVTPHSRKPRPKPCRVEEAPAIRAARQRAIAADIIHELPPVGPVRFDTFEEFEHYVSEYFAKLYGGYRRRSSLSTLARNNQLRDLAQKAIMEKGMSPEQAAAKYELLPWDTRDDKYFVAMWCVHGCIQASRGKGVRQITTSRFTGCEARVTAQLKFELNSDGEKVWFYEAVNEIAVHNHTVSQAVYNTYNTTGMILTDEELFKKVKWSVEVGGDKRLIRDMVSLETNSTYTQRKLDNLMRYWLGGAPVLRSVQNLLEAFAALPGSRCLVIKDDDGVLAGIVMQSAAQRALVQLYGDSLVLDWTHNTNNRGFHLGALVATTVNGTGVSVLDFLCVSQTHKMMESVFEFFIEHNPGGKEMLESVVIDKDLREWTTVEKIFQTIVVLCIFHVLKWFKWVITRPKYGIAVGAREAVLACLTAMVYAVSVDALEAQKTMLHVLLAPDTNAGHQAFILYMEQYWYPYSSMWSYAERGRVYTAGNTTSNRIESWWNQFKATLGSRRRLDSCIETIFRHATLVLQREEDFLATFAGKTRLYEHVDDKLRPLLMELSAYAATRVEKQWTRYMARRDNFRVVSRDVTNSTFTVRFSGLQDIDSCVNASKWTCSCRFYRGIRLPCRHLFFIAHEELSLPVYPAIAIARRWRMSEALSLLPTITQSIKQLGTLRTRLVSPAKQTPLDASARSANAEFVAPRAIAHLHLRKHEVSDSRVLYDLQKRNLCEAAVEPLAAFAMDLPMPLFKEFSDEFTGMLADFMAKWEERLVTNSDAQHKTTDAAAGGAQRPRRGDAIGPDNPDEALQQRPASADSIQVNMEDERADWLARRATPSDEDEQACEDEDEEKPVEVPKPLRVDEQPAAGLLSFGGRNQPCEAGEQKEETVDLLGTQYCAARPSSVQLLPSSLSASRDSRDEVDAQAADGGLRHALYDQLIAAVDAASQPTTGMAKVDSLLVLTDSEDDLGGVDFKRRRTHSLDTPAGGTIVLPQAASGLDMALGTAPTDQGLLASLTLPPEVNRGARKTAKHQSNRSRPLAFVTQTLDLCPIDVFQHNVMVRFSVPHIAAELQDRMPRVHTESAILRRRATATFMNFQPRALNQANAIVPMLVLEKLLAAVNNKRREDGAENYVNPARGDDGLWAPQYFARIGNLREFPEELLQGFTQFYELTAKLAARANDRAWLLGQWDVPDSPQRVPFLQREADAAERASGTLSSTLMRVDVKRAYDTFVLATVLKLPESRLGPTSQRTRIPFEELIGRIAFNHKLNDSVVNFSLQLLASDHSDVVVVDSLNVDKMRLPHQTLASTRLVCFPLHCDPDHWCILFAVREGESWLVWGYHPLVTKACHRFMEQKWDRWCRSLIRTWNARDQSHAQVVSASVVDVTENVQVTPIPRLEELEVTAVQYPKQPDSTCCGLFCIAQAADYMINRYRFQIRQKIEPFTVQLMRLRLMWLLLCKTTPVVDEEEESRASGYRASFSSYGVSAQK